MSSTGAKMNVWKSIRGCLKVTVWSVAFRKLEPMDLFGLILFTVYITVDCNGVFLIWCDVRGKAWEDRGTAEVYRRSSEHSAEWEGRTKAVSETWQDEKVSVAAGYLPLVALTNRNASRILLTKRNECATLCVVQLNIGRFVLEWWLSS